MMRFPATRVSGFIKKHPELRYGQEFYQYMELHKCEQDREFCDRLYQADGDVAKAMIECRTDWES